MPRAQGGEVYLTASEAYPALERAFLAAQHEVIASFRVFDPTTRLRSDAGLAVGVTWADLVAHVVGKGVRVTLRISDFDPIVGHDLHHATHLSVARLNAAVGNSPLFDVQPAMHPAKMGLLPRLLLWPRTGKELRRHAARLRDLDVDAQQDALAHMPALQALVRGSGSDLRAKLFPPPVLRPVTHHQKLAVFDKKRLYIGGLDLNDRRYDTLDHDRDGAQTWHDVQAMVEGRPAEAAHMYLTAFANGDDAGLMRRTPGILRTHSVRRARNMAFTAPRTVLSELDTAHRAGFRRARQLIYLETQFFRDRGLARALCDAARRQPGLCVILVLPAAPEDVAFEGSTRSDARYGEYLQAKCLDQLRAAFGARLFIAAAVQPRPSNAADRASLSGARLVYVHAKLSIFDGAQAIVSSANLNGRSLKWDTEAGVMLDHPETVAQLRQRCFAHWLGRDNGGADIDPAQAVDVWRAQAASNQAKPPADRRGFIVPYPIGPARRFGRNLPGIPEQIV